ncbi:hypothetical protein DFR29_103291 [Tahibacter aquaticus]|uniref:Uncharacterized protein n=1 Tax=Tahibacter aquaticus TaxID=520092 RepID=A0A4R6Z4Y9_9GAMM|nr:hypothetical protein DFR29_103291 [Tahibacter aquaticus]
MAGGDCSSDRESPRLSPGPCGESVTQGNVQEFRGPDMTDLRREEIPGFTERPHAPNQNKYIYHQKTSTPARNASSSTQMAAVILLTHC